MERNVPKLRFKGFNDEWEEYRIGDLCRVDTGNKDTQNKVDNGIYPFFVRSQNVERINTYSYDGEAILTAGDGVGVGKVFHYVNCKFDYHQRVYKLSDFNNVNGKFLYMYFSKNFKRETVKYNAKTSVDSVRREMITKMKIIMPSMVEQERIANFLTKVDKIIEKQEEKVKNLEKYKKGMMQKIFSQEIRFKDENGEEYPEWEEARLNNVLSIPEKIKTEIIEKDKLLTVKLHMQGIKVNKNVDTLNIGATVYYKRKAGQFIYGKQNFFNGAFGIVPEELDGYLSSGDIPALNINRDRIIPEYLINYIGRTEFYKKTENLSSGTGSKRIHEKTLLEIVINIPCVAEQERIANFLSNIDLVIDKENKKLEELKRWKKGLLQQMFV